MIHSFPLLPQSNGPIKNGALRLKRKIGASWAGQMLNAQRPTGIVVTKTGTLSYKGVDLLYSKKSEKTVASFCIACGPYTLLVYTDYSALLIQASEYGRARIDTNAWLTVLPLPLFLPKTFQLNGRKTTFSLQDWMEPTEIPSMDVQLGRDITAQIVRDAQWWQTLAQTLGPLSETHTNSSTTITPWFAPIDAVSEDVLPTLGGLIKALSLLGDLTPLELKGRTLDALGHISSVTITPIRPSPWWSKEKLNLAATAFDALPFNPTTQIKQNYIPSRGQAIQGFGPNTIIRSTQITPPKSAHDSLKLLGNAKHLIPQSLYEKETL